MYAAIGSCQSARIIIDCELITLLGSVYSLIEVESMGVHGDLKKEQVRYKMNNSACHKVEVFFGLI